ncbi:MAG: oligosaccharide flippase family protein [Vicinamibacterales bacterium]
MLAYLKNLSRNLAIYGVGDVATSLVSLLLLPVYTVYLTPSDYGVIAMLLTVEAVAKITFRWGVDTAFMRLYYDCADQRARQRLASTLFFFLLAVNGSLLMAAVMSADWLSELLFDTTAHAVLVALVIANTFAAGFFFIPLQVLRIQERSAEFIALSFARSSGTLVMRLVLVVWAGMGVAGVVAADVVVTAIFAAGLTRWFAPLIRPVFSRPVMAEALGFGLPRIPHGIAHQVIGLADRYFLNAYGTLRDVGLYSIGASFGLALKLFLSAFEYAWTPFFLDVMHQSDARRIYSTVSTYALTLLVLLVVVLSAAAPDLVRLFTSEQFHGAAAVTPWIALGVMFQGVYILGSIGLIITKRTTVYPLATGFAAVASLSANAALIPRYGMMGAAWANTIAYGTLAAVTVVASWRLYPIRYEWSRLLRVILTGVSAYLLARWAVPVFQSPLAGLVLNTLVTAAAYASVLFLSGFFQAGELRVLRDICGRARHPKSIRTRDLSPDQVEMAGEIIAAAPAADVPDAGPRREPAPRVTPDSRVLRG